MEQRPLFHESIYDALKTVVALLGGPKKVGPLLWPEKTVDAAAQLVRDCLNASRKERFDPEQMLFLLRTGREAGCHEAMYYLCDVIGYERPAPTDPEDELQRMLREYLDIQRRGDQLKPRIDEAVSRMAVRSIK